MIDESVGAVQLEATPFLEYETTQLETYFGQPDLMFHAKAFRVGDCFELGFCGCCPRARGRAKAKTETARSVAFRGDMTETVRTQTECEGFP